jgi:hypothetical protein
VGLLLELLVHAQVGEVLHVCRDLGQGLLAEKTTKIGKWGKMSKFVGIIFSRDQCYDFNRFFCEK